MYFMKAEALRQLLGRRPFQPLDVHMSNGEIYQIRYPDCAVVLRSTLFIGDPDADNFVICSFDQVANVNTPQAANNPMGAP